MESLSRYRNTMNKLLFIALVALGGVTAKAQTNIAYRITVDGVNTSWNYDASGTKKDVARIDGIKYAYGVYTNSIGTNAPLALGAWLKQQHVVFIDNYASQKQEKDNAAIAAKIVSLLTVNADLLSAQDLNSLNTIAAKAP